MGEVLGKLFVSPSTLPGGTEWHDLCHSAVDASVKAAFNCSSSSAYGFVQVLFLLMCYGFILFQASNLISDGSELLLLVPATRNLVGSVVLPVLGAVPDGAIVLFSGLGDDAQKQLSVGVGALAGSTIMLLTVPFSLCMLSGRVSIVHGSPTYTKPRGAPAHWSKLTPPNSLNIFKTGVGVKPSLRMLSITMLVTAISYLVIQGPAFYEGTFRKSADTEERTRQSAKVEKWFALTGLLMCLTFFIGYLVYQFKMANKEDKEDVVDAVKQKLVANGDLSLTAAFYQDIAEIAQLDNPSAHLLPDATKGQYKRLHDFLRTFYVKYDRNGDNKLDREEMLYLMEDLGERLSTPEFNELWVSIDKNNSGFIEFEEFVTVMPRFIHERAAARAHAAASPPEASHEEHAEGGEEEESDGDEEVPEDLRSEDPATQLRRIIFRSFWMMGVGTVLVLLFSDPMVEVLSDVGERLNIPGFYIAFVLAPLASNASEILASINYAGKKTKKTISISVSTLLGAAVMNNTFCLAIFLVIIFAKKLAWEFSAETIAILFSELCMGLLCLRTVYYLRDAIFIILLYPVAIAIVAVLENAVGLD